MKILPNINLYNIERFKKLTYSCFFLLYLVYCAYGSA